MKTTWINKPISPTCEQRVSGGECCGVRTEFAYPASGRGWMALCAEHAAKLLLDVTPIAKLLEAGETLAAQTDHPAREAERENAALLADKARLDFLDRMNARKNGQNNTFYGWKLEENHNRIALSDHHSPAMDVRAAIDAAIRSATEGAKP